MNIAAKLRLDAERCSRWALSVNDLKTLATLELLRLELETRAGEIERAAADI
jgi:hypothetical protein